MSVQARASHRAAPPSSRRASKLAPFHGPLRMAARRVRLERALTVALRWLPVAVSFSVAWVILLRFTLIELPQWPALVPLCAWAVLVTLTYSRTRVSTALSARYLDHKLGLDERLATYVELLSRQQRTAMSVAAKTHADGLAQSAFQLLNARLKRMPGIGVRTGRNQYIILAVCAAIVALAVTLPTPVDAVRAEKLRLAQSIAAQLQRVADLRADFIARPQIPDATRATLLAELDRLEAKLKMPGVDQASLLAAISDAQERLRELSPDLLSDFDAVIRAAQMVQDTVLRNSPWAKSDSKEKNDLGRAADASAFLASFVTSADFGEAFEAGFTPVQQANSSRGFEGASGVLTTPDGALARLLQDTSAALREKTMDHAEQLLMSVSAEFRKVEGRQQSAEAVEHALSSLDDSKQSIAQSTETKQKKAQVGFRRGQTGAAATTATAVASGGRGPSSGQTPGASQGSKSGSGDTSDAPGGAPTAVGNIANPGLGQNMPSIGGANPGNVSGNQPSKPGDSSGQTGDGKSGGNPKSGSSGDQPSSPGSSPQDGEAAGNPSSPITGPGGAVTGGITKVENPEGVGISSGGTTPTKNQDGSQDSITVPVQASEGNSGAGDGTVPTPEPNTGGSDSGIVGGAGPGGNSQQGGSGTATTIHTPFTEVLGQYAQRAATALDRAYIPQDAKEYVRDYFTELGK